MIRDGMKVVSRYGAPPESSWPYEESRFKERPPDPSMRLGQDTQVLRYLRCSRDLDEIKRCLYAGFPVVMGFTVYGSFESREVASSGLMPMPDRSEYVLGGHCVVWTGWDDDKRMPNTGELGALEVRNSWGTDWGDQGHFWMPYAYSQERGLSSDFWTVRQVEGHKRAE
jgi:C1A family cysteine protease